MKTQILARALELLLDYETLYDWLCEHFPHVYYGNEPFKVYFENADRSFITVVSDDEPLNTKEYALKLYELHMDKKKFLEWVEAFGYVIYLTEFVPLAYAVAEYEEE